MQIQYKEIKYLGYVSEILINREEIIPTLNCRFEKRRGKDGNMYIYFSSIEDSAVQYKNDYNKYVDVVTKTYCWSTDRNTA